ncbi:MAG: C39 family peptidase [Anaerolineae bacterium]|nr:C39 family peptidase [Anaerolineae bacterium]
MARSRRSSSAYRRPIPSVGAYGASAHYSGVYLRSRQQVSAVWIWSCGFLTSLACLGGCLLGIVIGMIGFRALPEDLQAAAARRVPILAVLMASTATPDPRLEVVPTVDPTRAAEAALAFGIEPISSSPTPPFLPRQAEFPTLTPTPTPTPLIGNAVLPTATNTPRPTATPEPLPMRYYLPSRVQREAQAWNNCGPANLVQGLRVLGYETKQRDVAAWLKPNKDDANVSPWQMASYTNQFTPLRAIVRVNGTLDLMKRLIYNGFGVIIETGLYDERNQWLGHYVTLVGWDDVGDPNKGGFLYGLDTLKENGPDGKGVREYYARLDALWKHFNRLYLVIYRPEQEGRLRELLGEAFDERLNAEQALVRALQETKLNPNDQFAWFNVGTSYVLLGAYREAALAYDLARARGGGWPWRMLWYQFGPFKAYYAIGDYQTVIDLANSVIQRMQHVEEAYYYRSLAFAALGKMNLAIVDMQRAVRDNGNLQAAAEALARLQAGEVPPAQRL